MKITALDEVNGQYIRFIAKELFPNQHVKPFEYEKICNFMKPICLQFGLSELLELLIVSCIKYEILNGISNPDYESYIFGKNNAHDVMHENKYKVEILGIIFLKLFPFNDPFKSFS